MPDGDMRRPPLLWEQRLAKRVNSLGPGVVTSSGANVVEDFGASTGYNEPDDTITTLGTPSTPTVTGTLKGVAVGWDGNDTDGDPYNAENQWVEVHVGGTAGFTPGTATKKGTLYEAGTWVVTPLTSGTTYYASLVGYDSEGNASAASAQGSAAPGLVISSDIGTGAVGTAQVSFNAREVGGITQTVGTAEPTGALEGDTWINTTDGSYNYFNGSSWVTQAWGANSIGGSAITETKISSSAITTPKLAAGAVTATAIAAGAVTATQIAAGAVIADKIGASAVTTAKLQAGAITADKIATGTITADKLAVSFLTATDVGSGGSTTIDGGRITAGTITGRVVRTSGGNNRVELADSGVNTGDSIGFYYGGTRVAGLYGFPISGVNYFLVSGNIGTFNNIASAGTISGATVNSDGALTSVTLDVSGAGVDMLGVYNNNTTGLDNVGINTSGRLRRLSSSQDIKYDMATLAGTLSPSVEADRQLGEATVQPRDVLDLAVTEFSIVDAEITEAPSDENGPFDFIANGTATPRTTTVEPIATERRVLGFIADDVADKFPIAATSDAAGKPTGVLDTAILAALLAVVKDQADTIADLTARIEALEG